MNFEHNFSSLQCFAAQEIFQIIININGNNNNNYYSFVEIIIHYHSIV